MFSKALLAALVLTLASAASIRQRVNVEQIVDAVSNAAREANATEDQVAAVAEATRASFASADAGDASTGDSPSTPSTPDSPGPADPADNTGAGVTAGTDNTSTAAPPPTTSAPDTGATSPPPDAGATTSPPDAGATTSPPDAGPTTSPPDAGPTTSPPDAGPTTSPPDAGPTTAAPEGVPTTPATAPPTTPEPTPEPTPSPDEDEDSVCFPAAARVELVSGRVVAMEDVAVGDVVRVGASFSPVFMFTHKMADVHHPFLSLHSAAGELALTPGHYLYVNGALAAAKSVVVGDAITLASGADAVVTAVESVYRRGLYNPQTLAGDIVVNGVVASTYTTAVKPTFAHAVLAPFRALAALGWTTAAFESGGGALAHVAPRGALVA